MEQGTAQAPGPDSELFCDVFNASPIGIAVRNLEGQLLFANRFLCSMLGFSEDELRSRHHVDFSLSEDAEKDSALFQQLRSGLIDRYQREKRFIRRDASLIWGQLTTSLLHRTSPLVLTTVEDITDRRTAEETRFRYTAIVESSEDAIISKSLDAVIESWNPGAQHIFGYTQSEALGQPITMLIPSEILDEENTILEWLRAGKRIEHYETIRMTKASQRVNVSLSIAAIKDSSGRMVGFSKIARDITARKLAEEVRTNISRKLVEIQEKERTRIAQELHDDINQRLALLAVEIDRLKLNPPNSSAELNCQLTEVWKGINEVSAGVQLVSHQLHSPRLEHLGLVCAMTGLCREFAGQRNIEIDFKSDDVPQRVSNDASLCLFRILQEALHNAVKHSGVRQFEVRLGCASNQLHLTVSDRGVGFEPESAMNKGGIGLISMHERVLLLGGKIVIESKPMGGTTIHVRVPFELERRSQLASG
jgi:PAS domain S-box-containing protein